MKKEGKDFVKILPVTNSDVSFRHSNENDFPLLLEIYRSTREEELSMTNWSDEQKNSFIESQFAAQYFHYEKYYADAEFWIILYKGEDAGRLYLHISNQIRIIDITLLPKFRKMGIGTGLLTDIQSLAVQMHIPVSIHVEQYNPALLLYKRLGFREIEKVNSIYYLMEWRAEYGIK